MTPFFFQRRFWPMWGAFALGAFTDNMLKQALLIGLTYNAIVLPWVDDGAAIVPVAGALFPLAMLLFSPIAGQVADKYETSRLFRITKFTEFCLMIAAAGALLLLGTPMAALSGPLLVAILFAMGIQSAFFSPVRIAAMPKYLSSDELIRGNALCNGALYTAILLGLLVGGLLIVLPNGPAMVGAILALAALAGWRVITLAPPAGADAPDIRIERDPFTQIVRQAHQVAGEPAVVRPLIGIGLFFFISTAVTIAVPIYTADTLNADSTVANMIMGLFVVGAFIGAVLSAMLSKGRSGLGFATTAMSVAAVLTIALYAASAVFARGQSADIIGIGGFLGRWEGWVLSGLFMACAAALGVYTVPLQAAVQRRARPAIRARIMAANNIVNAIAAMAGSLSVTSITATAMAPHQAFIAIALMQGVIAVYMIRRRRTVPEGLFDEALDHGPDAAATIKPVALMPDEPSHPPADIK